MAHDGSRPRLLLLHGALGASEQFEGLKRLLGGSFEVHALDFEGHGRATARGRSFEMSNFAANALDYLEARGIERTHIFGYSMGGYVCCLLALQRPDVPLSLMTLGTKYRWDPETARREVGYLDPDKIEVKAPHFARALEARHPAAGWRAVTIATAEMLTALGEKGGLSGDDVKQIAIPVRLVIGDHDSTVTLDETLEVYRALPRGELEILPGTPHPYEKAPVERLAFSIAEFVGRAEAANSKLAAERDSTV